MEFGKNTEGQPLRLHDLDIENLAIFLHENKIRTSQGKLIQPLHKGHLEVLGDPARFKVLACGRRWGKCEVITDTFVNTDGSITTFEELIGKKFKTFSYDENNEVIETDAYCEDNGIKPVYKITTKTGIELTRTGNHPLFTGEGWKTVEEGLQIGNRIFVPTQTPHEGKDRKDEKHLELLAYLIADGSISQNTYSFTQKENDTLKNFINCLDGTYRVREGNGCVSVFLHRNNSIYGLVEELGLHGKVSHTKFIPNWVYTSPNDQIALFLNRLYSCDGWASKGEIGYCSVSKNLVTDVKRLLARLGIVSNLQTKTLKSGKWKGNVAYQLRIRQSSEILKFMETVGILGKELDLDKALIYSSNSNNSQLKTLPKEFCFLFANKLKSLISYTEQEKTKAGRIRPDRANSREKLLYYCDLYPEEFTEEKKIITMPGYWDEIVSLSYEGEQRTAGLTVPGYHNFINDCLEHNTLIVSLMALAALFQLRRRVWIVAPDYGLTEKVFRELYNILVTQLGVIEPGRKGKARNQKGDYYLETPWGSVLEAKSLERPDSLAGEANDLVIVDEAALNEQIEDIWSQMIQPTLMDKEGSALFISTPRGKNQFYKLYLFGHKGKGQRDGKIPITTDENSGVDDDMTEWSSFKRTSYDNPLLASTPEKSKEEILKAYKRAVYAGKLVTFKQEYLADFEAVSDIVFPGFKADGSEDVKHPNVIDYIYHPDEGPAYAACDHNFAKPASTLFLQVNRNNDVVVFDERFTPRTTTYEQAQQILDKSRDIKKVATDLYKDNKLFYTTPQEVFIEDVIADVSGDQVQLNGRKAWDDFEEVLGYRPKGLKQDRETGCNLIRLWLQFPEFNQRGEPMKNEHGEYVTMPKLFVSRNCTNLIYALSSAKFRKTKNGALKEDYEETKEGYEGLLDALRYALVYLFHDTGQQLQIVGGH